MKVYKINSFTTFLISLFLMGIVIFLPIMIIEAIWNSTIGTTYDYLVINTWQALILWLIFLTFLNICGVFRFEFAIDKVSTSDLESIKKKVKEAKDSNTNQVENTSSSDNRDNKNL